MKSILARQGTSDGLENRFSTSKWSRAFEKGPSAFLVDFFHEYDD